MKPVPREPDSNLLQVSSRVAALDPGMYIFRYASDLPAEKSVAITLQQAPLGKGNVDFFPADGISKNTLTKLGDCIVARVRGGATGVLITELRLTAKAGGKVDLRIDRIDTSAAIMRPQAAPAAVETKPAELRLLGHIEYQGDVAATGPWLGNPTSTHRLEGFAVHWDSKPDGVDLAYRCAVRGAGMQQPVTSGHYAGTRRQAAPIVSVTFELVGPRRDQFQLQGEVAFAGSGPLIIEPGQPLAGRTGTEQLVALQLSILPKAEINAARYQSPWEDPAVTQIFVSKRADGQADAS